MQPTQFGGFMPNSLGDEGFNPAFLQRSEPILSRGMPADIQKRQAMLERGDFGGVDPGQFLQDLSRDMMLTISRAQTSGNIPVREDLQAPAVMLVPLDTPLRNKLPRTQGSSVASSWYTEPSLGGGYGVSTTVTSGASSATQTVGSTDGMEAGMSIYFAVSNAYRIISSVTNSTTVVLTATISTTTAEAVSQGPFGQAGQNAQTQMFFGETGAPSQAVATYSKITESYKLLGTLGSITGFAMAAGATFDNQLAAEKRAAILRTMLSEENALINGSSTIVLPPYGDGTNAWGFDGVLNLTTTANGVPGSHIQTAVGALTLAHVDSQVTRISNSGGMGIYMVVNAQEALSLVHLATGTGSINRIMGSAEGKLIVGATASFYVHPVTGELCPIMVSRFMPAGTMFFGAMTGPDGQSAMDVRVLPQVQLPELAPDEMIQGYVAQELAPAITSPQVYPFLVSVFEVLRMLNVLVFGKSTGVTPV